ncbi:DEAD/DEAH box helicase [bacterium]|nr:DEAD/DEAH box helicase [bacterium]
MVSVSLRPHQIECCDAQKEHRKGIICATTGAGKTLVGIANTISQFESETPQTVAIVAPRILLANQLSSEYLEHITNASVFHCHSGETIIILQQTLIFCSNGGFIPKLINLSSLPITLCIK